MAVAIHVGKSTCMDYNNKDFDKETWPVFRAWKVLSSRPKRSQRFPSAQEGSDGAQQEEQISDHRQNRSEDRGSSEECGSERASRGGQGSSGWVPERFSVGSRNAKLIRQEEMRTNAVRSMAESAKRKSTAHEERSAIAVFSRPEAANLPESATFFRALRETYLAHALKQARVAREEAMSSSAVTNTNSVPQPDEI